MDSGTILAIAIPVLVVLALVTAFVTASRRDRIAATGDLSRETRRRDRSRPAAEGLPAAEPAPPSGREVEARARQEQTGRAVVVAPSAAPPAPVAPMDPETLGVTRRQFLNRSIVNMFGIGLGGFGAACLAFLYPKGGGGFGSKVTLPESLDDILAAVESTRAPYYSASARTYIQPYPRSSLSKAESVYDASVLNGLEQGIVALYQKCVHLGCRVPWCASSQWFECPCHGSQYNRVGEKRGGPAPRGLDRFPVTIEGKKITVDTGLVLLGPPIGTNTTGQEAEGPHCTGGE